MRTWVQSLASLSQLRTPHCHDLWCRSQTWLGSHMAVAQAGGCSSESTPRLGTSMCHGCGLKKTKDKRQKKKKHLSVLRKQYETSLFLELPISRAHPLLVPGVGKNQLTCSEPSSLVHRLSLTHTTLISMSVQAWLSLGRVNFMCQHGLAWF